MKNYLQRLRCKSRINCQIPGTEPKGKRGKSTVAFSVQVPLPKSPLRVTDGDRKRRPRHLPGAPPAACLKNGAWGPQNPDNTGQVYSGLCTNCPAIKGRHLSAFWLLHSRAVVPWHQTARLHQRSPAGLHAGKGPGALLKLTVGRSWDPTAAGKSPRRWQQSGYLAPAPAAGERGCPGGAPPAQGSAVPTTGQRGGPSPRAPFTSRSKLLFSCATSEDGEAMAEERSCSPRQQPQRWKQSGGGGGKASLVRA